MHRRLGERLGAEEARQRRGEDQERKQRHQRGDRQMAGHRPAVVGVEMAERVVEHAPRRATNLPHQDSRPSDCLPAANMGRDCGNWQALACNAIQPMSELRTIIVTGASSGIGAYCARALKAMAGASSRRRASRRTSPRSRPTASRRSISTIASRTRSRRWWRRCWSGPAARLDALYNNGAYAQPGAVEDLPVAALREQFEANLFGWHDLTRRIVPVMRRAGPRPHRPLLVDPRPDAGPLSRRLCRPRSMRSKG